MIRIFHDLIVVSGDAHLLLILRFIFLFCGDQVGKFGVLVPSDGAILLDVLHG